MPYSMSQFTELLMLRLGYLRARSGQSGGIIPDVPVLKYILHVWHNNDLIGNKI